MPALVELPYLSLTPPALQECTGVDIAATSEWIIDVLLDPNNEAATVRCSTIDGITYGHEDIGNPGHFSHIAMKLQCTVAGPAKLMNICIRHDGADPAG